MKIAAGTNPRAVAARCLMVLSTMAACTQRPLVRAEPGTESYVLEEFAQAGSVPVDILVVVDDSRSMKEEQANLALQFPSLIRALLDPPLDAEGKRQWVPVTDLHVGVVSTDMGTGGVTMETCADPIDGDDGILQHSPAPGTPGCGTSYPTYLEYASGSPDPALVDRMVADFGCMATLGTDGCGFEQQLEAALKGLTSHAVPGGANSGFMRPDSILTVLFVTDEEDCSMRDPTIVTEDDPPNLKCFMHPDKVHPVSRYVDGFRALRPADRLVLGFIVGVPPDGGQTCTGSGDLIPDCLSRDEMQEIPEGDALRPACSTPNGTAYPGRRFVEIARQMGGSALVHSICTDDFGPAIKGLTDKLIGLWREIQPPRDLAIAKDPAVPCTCLAACAMIEELPDLRPCPAGKPCFEPGGPGTGCATSRDAAGQEHSLCEIPQAGTGLSDCSLSCTDPAAVHSPGGEGWYYDPYGDGGLPQVGFTDTVVVGEGSTLYLQCESAICDESRQCGPADHPEAVCCASHEYCDRPAAGVPACLPRPR